MVQAGVFKNVAIAGIHPCSSKGDNTIPVQNIACVCARYSTATIRQLSSRLRK